MRYTLNDESYIETISFLHAVECNNKTCTEYTGTIPEGYSSLAEWSENAVIQAYKVVDGNLTHDANKEAELETLYNEELTREIKITSTNTPPDTSGNWKLIDKDFAPLDKSITFSRSSSSSATLNCSRNGKNIYCRLTFVNSTTLNDTAVTIGKINISEMGVSDLTYGKYQIGQTDGGGGMLMMFINYDGTVTVNDVIDKGGSNQISSGNTCYVEWNNTINMNAMLDSACNKFYWKKIS